MPLVAPQRPRASSAAARRPPRRCPSAAGRKKPLLVARGGPADGPASNPAGSPADGPVSEKEASIRAFSYARQHMHSFVHDYSMLSTLARIYGEAAFGPVMQFMDRVRSYLPEDFEPLPLLHAERATQLALVCPWSAPTGSSAATTQSHATCTSDPSNYGAAQAQAQAQARSRGQTQAQTSAQAAQGSGAAHPRAGYDYRNFSSITESQDDAQGSQREPPGHSPETDATLSSPGTPGARSGLRDFQSPASASRQPFQGISPYRR